MQTADSDDGFEARNPDSVTSRNPPAPGLAQAARFDDRRSATFTAFISYRHAEPDRRWAKWLHGAIERYRVPKRLVRERNLPTRVGRIFRDEEELAASADLSAGIREALENSAYLIVVCSPRTPHSRWINAEVEQFRSLGRGDRILALLVEGEPEEAFPTALREIRPTTFAGERGRQEALEMLEPLAADVREGMGEGRRARERMAKLRLLATLLGCRFDDLRQREQERRTRLFAFAAGFLLVLATVIAGLGVWAELNRRTAVAERDRALRNQSLFLASLSKQEAARGDASVAMLLALEGLPRDLSRPDRPYVAEAESALWEAVYQRRELAVFRGDAPIRTASFSPDGKRVLTVPEQGPAKIWDSANGSAIATLASHESPIRDASFSQNGARVLTLCEDGTSRLSNSVDGKEVAMVGGRSDPISRAVFSLDGAKILTQSKASAAVWDATSGRKLAVLGTGIGAPLPFSPDGRRALTSTLDGAAHLWDTTSGREIATLRHGEGLVPFGGFSPDGERIVTVSIGGVVRIWDATWGHEVVSLRAPAFLTAAEFSPNGKRLLTSSLLGLATVWDVESGAQVAVFGQMGQRIQRAFFSPDGAEVVTVGHLENDTVLWDVTSGSRLASLGHGSPRFSPNGTRLLSASDGARLWDAKSGRAVASLGHDPPAPGSNVVFSPHGAVNELAFSTDSTRALTTGQDGTARIWSAADGAPVAVLRGHTGLVHHAEFSPDSGRVLTVSSDGSARLWDARGGADVRILRVPTARVRETAFSPDGTQLLAITGEDVAHVWTTKGERRSLVLRGHVKPITSAKYDITGKRIITASEDGTARIWDALNGRELAVLRGHETMIRAVAFSLDGTRALTYAADHSIRLWDTADGRSLAALSFDDRTDWEVFSPDGSRVVTTSPSPSEVRPGQFIRVATLWDVMSGRKLATFRGDDRDVTAAVFSPDGARILTTSRAGPARVWSAADGAAIVELPGQEDDVVDPAFSKDGRRILTVAYDEVARLWDAQSGKELAVLRQEIGVRHAFFSPDDSQVITLSSGAEPARIWDTASGKQLSVLRGHNHQITSAAISRDNRYAVTYSQLDGTVRLWHAPSGQQLAVLRQDRIQGVGFAPDGANVMVLLEDGSVYLFPVYHDAHALLAHALRSVPRQLTAADRRRYFLATESDER